MILTCPACGTQYVVKDGAIPPGGRQVRCASCRHSWHQDPEADGESVDEAPAAVAEEQPLEAEVAPDAAPDEAEATPEESEWSADPDESTEPAGYAPIDPIAPGDEVPAEPVEPDEWNETDEAAPVEPARSQWRPRVEDDSEFSPFASREVSDEERRSPLRPLLIALLVLVLLAAAFWFLAPADWKARVGLAEAGETPLQLVLTHSGRQAVGNGNELLEVAGRVVNPTTERQPVPPIRAQLHDLSGELVYSWTISPPAASLGPGESRPFNSAEVNVPAGGDELTISLGNPRA